MSATAPHVPFTAAGMGVRVDHATHGITYLTIDVVVDLPAEQHASIAQVRCSFDTQWNLFASHVDAFGHRFHFDQYGFKDASGMPRPADALTLDAPALHALAMSDVQCILAAAHDRLEDLLEAGKAAREGERVRRMLATLEGCLRRA